MVILPIILWRTILVVCYEVINLSNFINSSSDFKVEDEQKGQTDNISIINNNNSHEQDNEHDIGIACTMCTLLNSPNERFCNHTLPGILWIVNFNVNIYL